MLTVSSLIVEGALNRQESRGAHCRADYGKIMDNALHSNIMKTEEKELSYVK